MFAKAVALINAFEEMLFTPLPKETVSSEVQFWNAYSGILVTPSGIVIDCNELQPSKAA